MKQIEISKLAKAIEEKWIILMKCAKFNRENVCTLRRWIAEDFFKLDVTRDYFTLNPEDLAKVETLMKVCNFNGRNFLGRSYTRQFWYHLQKGKTLPF